MLRCVESIVASQMNRFLTRPISFNEVRAAVFGMDPGESTRTGEYGCRFLSEVLASDRAKYSGCRLQLLPFGTFNLLRNINHPHIVLISPHQLVQLCFIKFCRKFGESSPAILTINY